MLATHAPEMCDSSIQDSIELISAFRVPWNRFVFLGVSQFTVYEHFPDNSLVLVSYKIKLINIVKCRHSFTAHKMKTQFVKFHTSKLWHFWCCPLVSSLLCLRRASILKRKIPTNSMIISSKSENFVQFAPNFEVVKLCTEFYERIRYFVIIHF